MAKLLKASMPRELDLEGTYKIRFTALDPTTGDVISGVQVKNLVLTVEPQGGTTSTDLVFGPFMLVPGPGA